MFFSSTMILSIEINRSTSVLGWFSPTGAYGDNIKNRYVTHKHHEQQSVIERGAFDWRGQRRTPGAPVSGKWESNERASSGIPRHPHRGKGPTHTWRLVLRTIIFSVDTKTSTSEPGWFWSSGPCVSASNTTMRNCTIGGIALKLSLCVVTQWTNMKGRVNAGVLLVGVLCVASFVLGVASFVLGVVGWLLSDVAY